MLLCQELIADDKKLLPVVEISQSIGCVLAAIKLLYVMTPMFGTMNNITGIRV